MRSVVLVSLLAAAGCGRVFGIAPVPGDGAGDGDTITASFGETGTTTYTGVTRDTYLDSENPTLNFGKTDEFQVDGGSAPRLALLRFDLSKLPPQATAVSATLRVTTKSDASTATIAVVGMIDDWDEGTADGALGAANWTERMSGVLWSGLGAAPPSRDTLVLGTFVPAIASTAYDVTIEPAAVTAWIADPAHNRGVALVDNDSDGADFRSSDASETAERPVLTVVYRP